MHQCEVTDNKDGVLRVVADEGGRSSTYRSRGFLFTTQPRLVCAYFSQGGLSLTVFTSMPLFALSCAVQSYAWGKVGNESTVAKLAASNGDLAVDPGTPYAEYWFGTHVNGPAKIKGEEGDGGNALLSDWLAKNVDASTGQLPFLLKILSIAKCLSIQAHPNKALASQLHADRPLIYKDPNHKPEMAIAITPFEAMCQFRELSDILGFVDSVPEFNAVLGEAGRAAAERLKAAEGSETQKKELKALFSEYSRANADLVREKVDELVARIQSADEARPAEQVAVRLAAQYPGDIGVFAPFLLNVINLKPGEAVFLAANEPHAYICGDCVEVMATSDNVVRMGCTPKLRDVDVLVDMLTYNYGSPKIMTGEVLDGDEHTRLYTPWDEAVTEFQIERTMLSKAEGKHVVRPVPGPSLLLVLEGEGKTDTGVALGGDGGSRVFFLGANETVTIDRASVKGTGLVLIRACERL